MRTAVRNRHLRAVAKAVRVLTVSLLLIVLSGCFLYGPTSKKLTSYYSESKVVSARFFMGNGEQCQTEELELSRVASLVEKLDSMALTEKFAHTDYFWVSVFEAANPPQKLMIGMIDLIHKELHLCLNWK